MFVFVYKNIKTDILMTFTFLCTSIFTFCSYYLAYIIIDTDIYIMVEKDLRGAVSFIANRHSKPNNKCLNDYDKDYSNPS